MFEWVKRVLADYKKNKKRKQILNNFYQFLKPVRIGEVDNIVSESEFVKKAIEILDELNGDLSAAEERNPVVDSAMLGHSYLTVELLNKYPEQCLKKDLNGFGANLFHLIAKSGNIPLLKRLIFVGVRPEGYEEKKEPENVSLHCKLGDSDKFDRTILDYAALGGEECLQFVLKIVDSKKYSSQFRSSDFKDSVDFIDNFGEENFIKLQSLYNNIIIYDMFLYSNKKDFMEKYVLQYSSALVKKEGEVVCDEGKSWEDYEQDRRKSISQISV